MRKCGEILFFLLLASTLNSLSLPCFPHADLSSVGNISLLTNSPVVSSFNPAQFHQGLSLSYTNPYALSNLNTTTASMGFPLKHDLKLSFSHQYTGDELYHENQMTIALTRVQGPVHFGSAITGILQKTDHYETTRFFLLNTGISAQVKNVETSVFMLNVTNSRYKEMTLPVKIINEWAYQSQRGFTLGCGIQYETGGNYAFLYGTDVKIYPNWFIKTGYVSDSKELRFGSSWIIGNYGLTYAIALHPELEPTHLISVNYLRRIMKN